MQSEVKTGKVKWFNQQKGYGFICPDNGYGKDDFVHMTEVHNSGLHTLVDGEKVSYEIKEYKGRHSATNIRRV